LSFLTDLPPPVVVTDVQSLVAMAGDLLTVTCNVVVVENLANAPSLQWISPCSTVVTTNRGHGRTPYTSEMENNGRSDEVYSKVLKFQPLLTSHGGRYTCVARISIPGVVSAQDTESTNITDVAVQSKMV
jgi:hypothetical protein